MDSETLRLASTGLVEPEIIARRLGFSVDELFRRHGTEIRAAQVAMRGDSLMRLLKGVLTEQLEQKLPQHAAQLALKRRLAASVPPRRARPEPVRWRRGRWALAAGGSRRRSVPATTCRSRPRFPSARARATRST